MPFIYFSTDLLLIGWFFGYCFKIHSADSWAAGIAAKLTKPHIFPKHFHSPFLQGLIFLTLLLDFNEFASPLHEENEPVTRKF